MKLEQKILVCYEDYKNAIDSSPDGGIELKTFLKSYRKDEDGAWKIVKNAKGQYYVKVLHKYAFGDRDNKKPYMLRNWFVSKLPIELQEEAESYFRKKPDKYPLEKGVNDYIAYSARNAGKKFTLESFFQRYDPSLDAITSNGKRPYAKHYMVYYNSKDDSISFSEWLLEKLPENKKTELECCIRKNEQDIEKKKTSQYINAFEDYKHYIELHASDLSDMVIFNKFARDYNPEIDWESAPKKGLHKSVYNKWHKSRTKCKETGMFSEWFIERLPQEKKQEADYYLSGQYLKDSIEKKFI